MDFHFSDNSTKESSSVLLYAYSNNDTDTLDGMAVSKDFLSSTELLTYLQGDSETMSPSSSLSGREFLKLVTTNLMYSALPVFTKIIGVSRDEV